MTRLEMLIKTLSMRKIFRAVPCLIFEEVVIRGEGGGGKRIDIMVSIDLSL